MLRKQTHNDGPERNDNEDLMPEGHNTHKHGGQRSSSKGVVPWATTLYLAYSSLGVIYGDLGTSPLYTISSIFADFTPDREDVLQAVSLIFWSLTLMVLVKYVFIVLRAHDNGEGGTFALYSHLCRTIGVSPFGSLNTNDHKRLLTISRRSGSRHGPTALSSLSKGGVPLAAASASQHGVTNGVVVATANGAAIGAGDSEPGAKRWWNWGALPAHKLQRWFQNSPKTQRILLFVSIVATAMLFGDGVLTPAISVVSAVSGLEVAVNVEQNVVVGVSCAVLVVLFLFQYKGTASISFVFSPVITLWLLCNLLIGAYNISTYGAGVFEGLSPHHIVLFFQKHGRQGWVMMGSVMLCLTGAEAMFADLGHFSISAIGLSFGCFAYPCLVITYIGQGAYLIANPDDVGTVFWSSVPGKVFWPMLVLATAASVVASQALISACFSISRQAMMLGVFPRMRVVHTAENIEGQIYIAPVNYALMLLTVACVAGFNGDSISLGNAYGLTISFVMFATTCLVTLVMVLDWGLSAFIAGAFLCFFGLIDGTFVSANLSKVPHGGWFALAITVGVVCIDLIWWAGQGRRRAALALHDRLHPHELFTIVRKPSSGSASNKAGSCFSKLAISSKDGGLQAVGEGVPFEQHSLQRSSDCSDLSDDNGHEVSSSSAKGATAGPLGEGTESPKEGQSLLHNSNSDASKELDDWDTNLLRGSAQLALTSRPFKPLVALPGIGLYYSGDDSGVPAVMRHFIRNIEALHQVNIFVTCRFLPIPHMDMEDRLQVRAVHNLPNFYRAIVRYGYLDVVDHGPSFIDHVVTALVHLIEDRVGMARDAGVIHALEDDPLSSATAEGTNDVEAGGLPSAPFLSPAARAALVAAMSPRSEGTLEITVASQGPAAPATNSHVTLEVPFEPPRAAVDIGRLSRTIQSTSVGHHLAAIRDRSVRGGVAGGDAGSTKRQLLTTSRVLRGDEDGMAGYDKLSVVAEAVQDGVAVYPRALEDAALRVTALLDAARGGVVYYFGHCNLRTTPGSGVMHDLLYEKLYRPMLLLSYAENEAWRVPINNLVELGMVLYV